ncbi:MAG: DUF4445 domain-containing protein [Pelotomaculum sp.]|nr:DUF4445 domain-containing protein [Pelotomaculum sp.]
MPEFSVRFLPEGKQVMAAEGESLFRAAARAGVLIDGSCGGQGACSRCKVIIKEGKVRLAASGNLKDDEKRRGYVLACRSFPESDLVVEIPVAGLPAGLRAVLEGGGDGAGWGQGGLESLSPLYRKVFLSLKEPAPGDGEDDLARLSRAIRKETGVEQLQPGLDVLRSLPKTLRDAGWKVTVSLAEGKGCGCAEIAEIEPGRAGRKYYGLAVDIGTTTVVAHLVDLESGRTESMKGAYNRQSVYGEDVISRIIYACEHKDGLEGLQKAVLDTVNGLIREMTEELNIKRVDIKAAVCAGNTAMTHLFLGIDPTYIRLEPYTPAANKIPAVRAGSIGLDIHPQAWVNCVPGVAGFVGGDIVAGVLASEMAFSEKMTLFIDVGTNGEMVLGGGEWLVACACSAGPAFEGGGIRHGLRAVSGAIEHVEVAPGSLAVKYSTVDGVPPLGICGSGLIEVVAQLYKAGVIDRGGNFVFPGRTPRIRDAGEGREFVLVWPEEPALPGGIAVSEAEIKNLLRSKAAVYAGIRSMLKKVGLPAGAIERVIIAGGFGGYINIREAVNIGLLPDIPLDRYTYIGNASVKGAAMALLSRQARQALEEIAGRVTYLDLSADNTFMDEFVAALFIPHTDLSLFPTVT